MADGFTGDNILREIIALHLGLEGWRALQLDYAVGILVLARAGMAEIEITGEPIDGGEDEEEGGDDLEVATIECHGGLLIGGMGRRGK